MKFNIIQDYLIKIMVNLNGDLVYIADHLVVFIMVDFDASYIFYMC